MEHLLESYASSSDNEEPQNHHSSSKHADLPPPDVKDMFNDSGEIRADTACLRYYLESTGNNESSVCAQVLTP